MAIFDGSTSFVKDGQIKYPVRIGHEWSGIVESVGEKVKNFKVGDRVFSDCAVTCGKCEACKRGDKSGCTDVRSLGTVHTWDGCYAEYMYIPERNLYLLPVVITGSKEKQNSQQADKQAIILLHRHSFDNFYNRTPDESDDHRPNARIVVRARVLVGVASCNSPRNSAGSGGTA